MAEILIKAVDATNIDSAIDKTGCYKNGDPIVAMPDDHVWSEAELSSLFYILKIPGLSVDDAKKKYLQPEMSPPGKDAKGVPLAQVSITRRLYKFDEAKAPPDAKTTMLTQQTLDSSIVNKTSGKTITEEVIAEK